jgi:hypothetical protein
LDLLIRKQMQNFAQELYVLRTNKYRFIHKSLKHFKNSKQIDYATDCGNSYADRERNSPRCF